MAFLPLRGKYLFGRELFKPLNYRWRNNIPHPRRGVCWVTLFFYKYTAPAGAEALGILLKGMINYFQ